jgi:hypothetical protein
MTKLETTDFSPGQGFGKRGWNSTGALKRVSTSTMLRGSVERFISYWFYSTTFHSEYKDMYCKEEDGLCPSTFRTNNGWSRVAAQMSFTLGAGTAQVGEVAMRRAMLALMRTDAFSFLMHMKITAKVFGGVYGEPDAYVPVEGEKLVITNANPRKGRTPEEFTHWQLDRLSGFVQYDAGVVDFAKHLLVHRCGRVKCMCVCVYVFCFYFLLTSYSHLYTSHHTHTHTHARTGSTTFLATMRFGKHCPWTRSG